MKLINFLLLGTTMAHGPYDFDINGFKGNFTLPILKEFFHNPDEEDQANLPPKIRNGALI